MVIRYIRTGSRNTGLYEFEYALTWYNYKVAITIASCTAFFTGIGQLVIKLIGG